MSPTKLQKPPLRLYHDWETGGIRSDGTVFHGKSEREEAANFFAQMKFRRERERALVVVLLLRLSTPKKLLSASLAYRTYVHCGLAVCRRPFFSLPLPEGGFHHSKSLSPSPIIPHFPQAASPLFSQRERVAMFATIKGGSRPFGNLRSRERCTYIYGGLRFFSSLWQDDEEWEWKRTDELIHPNDQREIIHIRVPRRNANGPTGGGGGGDPYHHMQQQAAAAAAAAAAARMRSNQSAL